MQLCLVFFVCLFSVLVFVCLGQLFCAVHVICFQYVQVTCSLAVHVTCFVHVQMVCFVVGSGHLCKFKLPCFLVIGSLVVCIWGLYVFCLFRFNVTGSLQLVNRFLLMPGSLSSAKYTRDGELFARLKLEDVLSEDSSAGRLILQNAQTAWVAPASTADSSNAGPKPKTKVRSGQRGKNISHPQEMMWACVVVISVREDLVLLMFSQNVARW